MPVKKLKPVMEEKGTALFRHIPVMTAEVIDYLNCGPGKIFADCTLGGAGHAQAVLEKITPGGKLIGIDRDKDAIANAEKILSPCAEHIRLFHGNYTELPEIAQSLGISGFDGILADLGISLYQIEGSGRGFSFSRDEPLDMRMDTDSEITAAYLVNTLKEEELSRIFWDYGEERYARKIARRIVNIRSRESIQSGKRLAQIVCEVAGHPGAKQRKKHQIHPATRVFMALRIAVNNELENVKIFMAQVSKLLNPGGRLCVISFHSLEDRIVKQAMKSEEKPCICPPDFPQCICGRIPSLCILTRKPCVPSEEETGRNPMSRSAKLRVAEKCRENI